MDNLKIKKVYFDALKIYQDRNLNIKNDYHTHLSRLFRYALDLKRMDFLSKNCLNLLFREALILNGYSKSQEFMEEVKNCWRNNLIWFENGLIIFKGGEQV
jgi:hypothetical protein